MQPGKQLKISQKASFSSQFHNTKIGVDGIIARLYLAPVSLVRYNECVANLSQKSLAPILVGVVSLILVLGALGYFFLSANSKEAGEEKSPQRVTRTDNNKSATISANSQNSTQGFSGTLLAGRSSPLLAFEKADYDKALKTDKLIVLYFYANWCPICRAEFPKMEEVFDELETSEVIGLQVNFNDSETDDHEVELARELGVAYQHTKVFLKNGKRILKSPESWEKDRYTSEINKALEK